MSIEKLMIEYDDLTIKESPWMPRGLTGLYFDNMILLDKRRGLYEKHGILAEEIGHLETTYGDITDMSCIKNRKKETIARRWGYRKVLSLDKMIDLYRSKHFTLEEVCMELEITPEYLSRILNYYREKYGISVKHNNHIIYFEPFLVKEI